MAYFYVEEEAWKCPKHPSSKKRRTTTTGVCSICLRDRLSKLCPYCANVRPCSLNCAAAAGKLNGGEPVFCRSKSVGIPFRKSQNVNSAAAAAASSSSSDKISGGVGELVFCRSKSAGIPFLKSRNVSSGDRRKQPESEKTTSSFSSSGKIIVGGGEAVFCRSKSVGIPFLKSRNVSSGDRRKLPESEKSNKTTSIWWIFRKKGKENESESMMMTSVSGGNDVSCSPEKLKGWYLVSPMKVFRQSSGATKLIS